MITIAYLVGLVVTVLAVPAIGVSLRGRALKVRSAADLAGRVRPLDLAAFRNLTDPREAEYLQENLPGADFRRVQRARLVATAAYVRQAASNAAVLLRLGEAARDSRVPAVAEAGRLLSEQALQLRITSLSALARIGAAWVWPGLAISVPGVEESYQRVTSTVTLLGRLQQPARPSAIFQVR